MGDKCPHQGLQRQLPRQKPRDYSERRGATERLLLPAHPFLGGGCHSVIIALNLPVSNRLRSIVLTFETFNFFDTERFRHIACFCRQATFAAAIPLLLCIAAAIPANAQLSAQAELLTARADSAIGAGDLAQAETFTRKALDLARKDRNDLLEAKILVNLISIRIEQENNIVIDEWYDRAFAIVSRQGDRMELANLWNIKARHLMYNQEYLEAREYYAKAGEVYGSLGATPVVAYYYNDLGYLEEAEGNHQAAAAWFLKSIRIFEATNDRDGLANTLGNISNTYFNLEEPEKALQYARRSLGIRRGTGDKEGMAIVLGNMTRIYLHMGAADSAEHYQQEYIRYASQSGRKKTLADAYVNLAMMLHAEKRFADAFRQIGLAIAVAREINHPNLVNFYRIAALLAGKMDRSGEMELYYDSCRALLEKNGTDAQYRDYYATRMHYFKGKDDYKSAFENFEKYILYKDALLNEEVKKQVAQYEIQYESQKKNAEVFAARSEKIRQQLYYNIALGLLITVGLLCLILFNRYRYRKKLEQKNLLLSERSRISAELHDGVGSSLSAIHLMSYAAMSQSEGTSPGVYRHLEKINAKTRAMMENISDIVWSMDPDNDQLSRVASRMRTFAAELLEAGGIGFRMEAEPAATELHISPEKAKDLYLAFKEAINNAAKHSGAKQVLAVLRKNGDRLLLSIADDGEGFDAGNETVGQGLKNMRRRIERQGGQFEIEPGQGRGTVIVMLLPYAS